MLFNLGFTLVATVLAVTSASALHITPLEPRAAAKVPQCNPPSTASGIVRPKANATLTPQKPFLFSFCSPTYFKTSSHEIFVGFDSPYDNQFATLLKVDLKPGQYTQNLTFGDYDVPKGAQKLVVYEVQNGYYNAYNLQKFTIPVNIKSDGNN
ncbi:hypothetical protein OC846_003959 [Tilletia horrida]|uniref:Uncharacterized protein n=1 Tax=Tilletia horrida TaxID=155126 RepID=A0AAN6GNI5_9BASI|nr:hypothetical protein OC845_003972 [Tilletia horrida]KAK0549721.1 hypothetical protein OC846_003959 [Tilletia horrida]KAK0569927.1 hypothetical protein OC861_000377 [Tilletia horrida]